ncbi:ribonuclease H-like domain-containing protein [Mycena galopus ATCC 62051]|nr:ribonuclease H-like domain-containing protein [Mycena galopus ATCC 62051]
MQSLSKPSSSPSISPPATRYYWSEAASSRTKLVYITDADRAEAEISKFKGPACGIDIEWKPTFLKGQPENPVALLQLANNDTILLLHLCHMTRFPTNLQAFLEDSSVKAGVGIQGDAKKLFKDCTVNIRNCVDLSLLARSVDNARWKGNDPVGLARLVAAYEDRLLVKGKITRSNWENLLDSAQQEYASNDAHAGYTLYMRLHPIISAMEKPPHPRCYTFDAIRGRLCEPSGMTWSPFNPDYDPGPPPPPKVPRPSTETSAVSTGTAVSSGSPKKSRWKRSIPRESTPSVRSSSTLVRDQEAGDMVSTPPVKRKRQRPRNRQTT